MALFQVSVSTPHLLLHNLILPCLPRVRMAGLLLLLQYAKAMHCQLKHALPATTKQPWLHPCFKKLPGPPPHHRMLPTLGSSADQKRFPLPGPKSTFPGPIHTTQTQRCRLINTVIHRNAWEWRNPGSFPPCHSTSRKKSKREARESFLCVFVFLVLSFPFYITCF